LKALSNFNKPQIDSQKYEDILNSIKEEDSENSTKIIEKLLEKSMTLNQISQSLNQIEFKQPEEFFDEEQKQDLKSEDYSEDQEKTENLFKIEETLKSSTDLKLLSEKFITNFYIMVGEEKHKINLNWTLIDFFRKAKHLLKSDVSNLYDVQIYFEFVHFKDMESSQAQEYSTQNQEEDMDLAMLTSTIENISNLQEKFFFRNYSDLILGNRALYTIKRASPFFYLISLFELCVNNYCEVFGIKERIEEKILENQKISSLLTKQVRDPFAISSNTIPTWCKDLCQNYPFLANFNSRYLFFKTCSFENKRSMVNLAVFVKNFLGETIFDDKTLGGSLKRKKYKVDRNNLLQYVEKILQEVGNFSV
jgi:hypothetical protein